jgi:hypothetical protein
MTSGSMTGSRTPLRERQQLLTGMGMLVGAGSLVADLAVASV